jgi:DNA-binding beta-propeller fold protein YncE
VGDLSNHAVRKITPAGIVSTLTGDGHPGFADEIAAPGALFSQPSGIAVDASGNIYVADVGNSRIRKLQ